jgi:hypothetical protein
VTVPYGTRSLFITCADGKQKQFRGIRQILRNLAKHPASSLIDWKGGVLDLDRRRVLVRVLVSGHGHENTAGIELSSKRELRPRDLRLPHNTKLYLMGCFQGREQLLRNWALGTGVAMDRVYGCTEETESALSTCLLLHLLEGLADLKASGLLTESFREFDEFLGVIGRHPAYLTGLV